MCLIKLLLQGFTSIFLRMVSGNCFYIFFYQLVLRLYVLILLNPHLLFIYFFIFCLLSNYYFYFKVLRIHFYASFLGSLFCLRTYVVFIRQCFACTIFASSTPSIYLFFKYCIYLINIFTSRFYECIFKHYFSALFSLALLSAGGSLVLVLLHPHLQLSIFLCIVCI